MKKLTRATTGVESNGLGPGATLFAPADVMLSIALGQGPVPDEFRQQLERLDSTLVQVRNGEISRVEFEDDDNS